MISELLEDVAGLAREARADGELYAENYQLGTLDCTQVQDALNRCAARGVQFATTLETLSRYLHWLTLPRVYDGEAEPIVCPYCNGAIDDHRGNCKIEAAQTLSLFQQLESLSRERALCSSAMLSVKLELHKFCIGDTVLWEQLPETTRTRIDALIEGGEKGERNNGTTNT